MLLQVALFILFHGWVIFYCVYICHIFFIHSFVDGHLGCLYCWWECKLVQPLCRTVWRFLKNRSTVWSSNPTPGHISGENYNSKRYMHPNVHCSTIYNSQGMGAISHSFCSGNLWRWKVTFPFFLNFICFFIQQFLISYPFYTYYCIYVNPSLPVHSTTCLYQPAQFRCSD